MGGVFSHQEPELQIIMLPDDNDFGIGSRRKKKNKCHSRHSHVNNIPQKQMPLPIYGYPGYPIISGYPANNNFPFPYNPYIPFNPYMPYPTIPYQTSKQFPPPNFYEQKNQIDYVIKEYKKQDSLPGVGSRMKKSRIGSKKSSKLIPRSKQLVQRLEKILNSNEPLTHGDQVAIGPLGITEPEQKAEVANQLELMPPPIYDQPELEPIKPLPNENDKSQLQIMPTIKILMKNDDGTTRNIGGFTSSVPIISNNLDQAKDKEINRAHQPSTPPLDMKPVNLNEIMKQNEPKTEKTDSSKEKMDSNGGRMKKADNLARNNMGKMEVLVKILPQMSDKKLEKNEFVLKHIRKKINNLNVELKNKIVSKSRSKSRKHKSKSTSKSRRHRANDDIGAGKTKKKSLTPMMELKSKQTAWLGNKNEIKMDHLIVNQDKMADIEKSIQFKKMANLVPENIERRTEKIREKSGSKKSRKTRNDGKLKHPTKSDKKNNIFNQYLLDLKTSLMPNENLDPNSNLISTLNQIKNESPKFKDQNSVSNGSSSSSSGSGSNSGELKHRNGIDNNKDETPALVKIQKMFGNFFSKL